METTQHITTHRWVRSKDGMVAGVAKGLAKALNMEVTFVRLLWIVAMFCGIGFLAYIILAVCLPREDRIMEAEEKKLAGVCLRLARRLGMEVGVVRALMVVAALSSLGVTILFYIVLAFALEEPA